MIKKLLCVLIISTSAGSAFAQKVFEVQDFSKDFYGKIYLAETAEVFSKGWVAIYEKKTNKQLIKVESEELTMHLKDGKANSNINLAPYGEQSAIIYEDFNFDGVKDFAIMDGQQSCYHLPSFKIYLADKIKNTFDLNPAFTRLAQEYCGMFQIDQKEKKIKTMTKSGCCWHQYSQFIVESNTPKAILIEEVGEEDVGFPLVTSSMEKWDGKEMVKTTIREVDLSDEKTTKVLFSFKTQRGGDEIVVFRSEDILYYVFINEKKNVELAYPSDSTDLNPSFTFDSDAKLTTLIFTNKDVIYKIYETRNKKIGIQIDVGEKSSNILGNLKTQKGSLRELANEKLTNVNLSK